MMESGQTAYCVKCKTKRELQDAQVLKNARGGSFTRGRCAVCGTTLTRFGGQAKTKEPKGPKQTKLPKEPKEPKEPNTETPNSEIQTPERQVESADSESEEGTTKARKAGRRQAEGKAPRRARGATPERTGPPAGDGVPLVIVESPAKAKTVGRFLGRDYRVRASVGHIRDLPQKQMGVDLEHNFTPHYVITPKKKAVVKELKEFAKNSPEIYLATDPDREGEAISWHLSQALDKDISGKPVRRVEFHEITRDAVDAAFSHPREIDMNLVNAQQARRVLDRIVGYTISPLLRKKMSRKNLSAGRVQSVAVRLVVEREREIQNFVPVEYWSIEAELRKLPGGKSQIPNLEIRNPNPKNSSPMTNSPAPSSGDGRAQEEKDTFRAKLVKVGEKEFECHTGEEALRLKETLEKCRYRVLDVRRKDVARNPAAPFITSTLQQEASRKLGFNAKRTMAVAQQLYEGLPVGEEGSVGLITYMRTDSTNIAESARKEAWAYIKEKFGDNYLPDKPRFYAKKVAGAQEAHEAIRPTKTFREPKAVRQYLNSDQFRLYDLIWKRFVASQMASAIFDTTAVDIAANEREETKPVPDFLFRANGSLLKFAGFLAVYGRSAGDEDEEDDADRRLPPLERNEPLDLIAIIPEQHFTEPPPRYTEATLIKALEQFGIGRPSTYAPILSNIQDRGYIEQIERRRLKPTELGFIVNDLLVAHFTDIVDVGFTAKMEERLDEIAEGKEAWVQVLSDFYAPFKETLQRAASEMPERRLEDEKTDIVCEVCGSPMVIKHGRFGKFIACSTFPKCKNTKSITTGVRCPECGKGELTEKHARRGPRRAFYGCSRYPDCKFLVNERPVPEPCPNCKGLLVANPRGAVHCTKCDYKRTVETAVAAENAPTP